MSNNHLKSLRLRLEVGLEQMAAALSLPETEVVRIETESAPIVACQRYVSALASIKGLQASWLGTMCPNCGHLHPVTAQWVSGMQTICDECGAPFRGLLDHPPTDREGPPRTGLAGIQGPEAPSPWPDTPASPRSE